MQGQLFIVAAPSGAGKTTLVRMLLAEDPIQLSISHTTRAPRAGEQNGEAYHFVSPKEFQAQVAAGDFLEWAEVHGNLYGTSASGVSSKLAAGQDVLLEIDWQGAQQVRARFPEAIGIFILPPSLETLAERLEGRGTDSPTVIARRLAAAQDEMRHVGEFDYVIINASKQRAFEDLRSIVQVSRLRYATQKNRHAALFSTLI